jgi:maleamate amidohydrolase
VSDAETAAVYRAAEIGGGIVRGHRPALLVVDLQRGFTEPAGPVGSDLTAAVVATGRLLDAARAAQVPVVFTVIGYREPAEAGVWLQKMPRLGELRCGGPWTELDPRLDRREREPVVVKHGASALFGTDVAAMLGAAGADTVIVAGATTSGCIRATVVDLMQAGFPTLVVADACGDRARAPHDANLFDMAAKYADVVGLDEACTYLDGAVAPSTSPPKELIR